MHRLHRLDQKASDLVAEYFPLARAIARQTHARLPRAVELDDLVSAAVMSLMDAVERYDASRGIAFKAYAKHRIQGAVLDSLRTTDWVPRGVRRRAATVSRTRTLLRIPLGREPSATEIGDYLGLDGEAMQALMRDANPQPLLSLDAPRDQHGASHGDLATDGVTPELTLQDKERRALVALAIEQLPERERVAIVLFYFREVPLKEVGAVLGVTESRACQLCSQAVKRLRGQLLSAAA